MKTEFFVDSNGSAEHLGKLIGGTPKGETRELVEIEVTEEQIETIRSGAQMKIVNNVIELTETPESIEKKNSFYIEKRKTEYPSVGDQLDAIRKYMETVMPTGTEADELHGKVKAVKVKYPKPL